MGWIILIAIAYLPIFYRIHKRLSHLEKEVARQNGEKDIF